MAFACLRTVATMAENERFMYCILTGDRKKVNKVSYKQGDMGIGWPYIHIDGQTEYSLLQDHIHHLEGPAEQSLVWAAEIE